MSRSKLDFIDAHHHLWDLQACHYPWLMAQGEKRFFGDPAPIQKNYLPAHFLAETPRYRPRKSVHIQVGVADGDALLETQWLETQDEFPHAIVAFCDLTATTLAADLDAQLRYSRVRGIRQIVGRHAEEDLKHGSDTLLDNPAWLQGLRQLAARNLSFDLQLIPPQMERMYQLLQQVPELRVALCHCGSPWDQSKPGLAAWRSGLDQFASLPNVYCKVSGLGMFNHQWQEADLRPLVLDVIDRFSPQRVMFGSNFPVDKLYRSYQTLWQSYEHIISSFTQSQQQHMLCTTAESFYRL